MHEDHLISKKNVTGTHISGILHAGNTRDVI